MKLMVGTELLHSYVLGLLFSFFGVRLPVSVVLRWRNLTVTNGFSDWNNRLNAVPQAS